MCLSVLFQKSWRENPHLYVLPQHGEDVQGSWTINHHQASNVKHLHEALSHSKPTGLSCCRQHVYSRGLKTHIPAAYCCSRLSWPVSQGQLGSSDVTEQEQKHLYTFRWRKTGKMASSMFLTWQELPAFLGYWTLKSQHQSPQIASAVGQKSNPAGTVWRAAEPEDASSTSPIRKPGGLSAEGDCHTGFLLPIQLRIPQDTAVWMWKKWVKLRAEAGTDGMENTKKKRRPWLVEDQFQICLVVGFPLNLKKSQS